MKNAPSNSISNKMSKGRQRIPIDQRREKDEDCWNTFSKRRNGLYKKISDLSIDCGLDFIAMMLSPSGKLYSFTSPNMESIAMRLLNNQKLHNRDENDLLMEASYRSTLDELTRQFIEVSNLLDQEEEREKRIDTMVKARQMWSIIDTPISDLSDDQVKILKDSLNKIQDCVKERINQLNSN